MIMDRTHGLGMTLARLLAALAAIFATPALAADPRAIHATIDISKTHDPVSPYEYGMFIEPIGGLIARTLWAEMLDDRKFYYPVVEAGKDPPPPLSVEGHPGIVYRKWRPIEDASAVTMDTHDPFVGAQSVAVSLAPGRAHGIVQGGLSVTRDKTYLGHVLLAGDAGAKVSVILSWGSGPRDSQRIDLPALTPSWVSRPFAFTAGADATDARFEIVGTGSGRFRIGVASLMPADNVDGWRADTTSIARSLRSGIWRMPGGNFLSDWDWHGALGSRDKRAPMFDYAWSAMQANDLGMDEFMTLARLVGVEPYVTVNAGLGDANSAAEEVEYLNGPATSVWGGRRASNGHSAPYGVKYWNIGNEPYGWWQIGRTSLDYFMIKHNAFATAMRAADPSIVLLGSGAMPDQLHPREAKENASLQSIEQKFGTEQDWTGGLLARAWGSFDGLTEHWYDRAEKRPDASAADELIEFTRAPSNQVRMKAEEWAIYQQRFPAMKARHIFLSIDEFAYTGATANLKLSLAYAMVLQEMLRHTDFLTMSAFTSGVSTMDITPTASTLNATGEVFRLYGDHFGEGTIPLEVDGDRPQPDPRHATGFDHPKVKAGSPTYPLDMIAGLGRDRHTLKIAVVNATFTPQPVSIDLTGLHIQGPGKVWRLTGASPDAANKVGQAPGVTIHEEATPRFSRQLIVPAISASIFEFPLG
jgi:alpha-N-arabinofuranosidase